MSRSRISPATTASCIWRRSPTTRWEKWTPPRPMPSIAMPRSGSRSSPRRPACRAISFAASCSVYGAGHKLDLDESDPLNPLTAYAKSKIETEQAVSALADDSFTPAYLRNATAYGHSPMLRIDLVVNNLLACAVATGEIRIMSDGSPWRPLIHCRDIARAFIAFMNAPKERIHNKAINVGGNTENYQVRDIGDQVKRSDPELRRSPTPAKSAPIRATTASNSIC